jgi:ATP-dependent DNA helicase PIF1
MNKDQRKILKNVKNNNNVFVTGEPGTGKTYTLQHIIQWAKQNNVEIGVTAMTGIAAVIINGSTLHSFLGIGFAQETPEVLAQKTIKKNYKVLKKLKKLKVLIIDEISMLNDELFDKVSKYLSIIRNCVLPFGGLQIICVGDFAQLPPCDGEYCFKSKIWDTIKFKNNILSKSVRHKDDLEFHDILRRLRWGKCIDSDLEKLENLRNTTFPEHIIPTRLYSLNVNVDEINQKEFKKLLDDFSKKRTPVTYKVEFPDSIDKNVYSKILNMPDITLCEDAQIVITRNIDNENGLVNGTRGVIKELNQYSITIELIDGRIVTIEFYKHTLDDFSNNDDKNLLAVNVFFMPIKLAWAITVHKSQGMTLDAVEIDLGKTIFAYGQAYTALSRARSLKSIKLIDVRKKSFKTHPDVISFYHKLLNL